MAYVPEERFSKLSRVASTFAKESLGKLSNPIEATNNLQGVYNQVLTLIGAIEECQKHTFEQQKVPALQCPRQNQNSLNRWGSKVDILADKLVVAEANEQVAEKVLTTGSWPFKAKMLSQPSSMLARYGQKTKRQAGFLDRKLPSIINQQKAYEQAIKEKLIVESPTLKNAKISIQNGSLSINTYLSQTFITVTLPTCLHHETRFSTDIKNDNLNWWPYKMQDKTEKSIINAVENRSTSQGMRLVRANSSSISKVSQPVIQNSIILYRQWRQDIQNQKLTLQMIRQKIFQIEQKQPLLRQSDSQPSFDSFKIDQYLIKKQSDAFVFQVDQCSVSFHLDNFQLVDRTKTVYRLPMLQISNNIPSGMQQPIHILKQYLKQESQLVREMVRIIQKLKIPQIKSYIFVKISDCYVFCQNQLMGRRYIRKVRQLRQQKVYGLIGVWGNESTFMQYDPQNDELRQPFEMLQKGKSHRMRQILLIKGIKNAYDEVKTTCPFFKDRLVDILLSDQITENKPSVTFEFEPAKTEPGKYRIDFMAEMTHYRHIRMSQQTLRNGEVKRDLLKWIKCDPNDQIEMERLCQRIMRSLVYIKELEEINTPFGQKLQVKVFSK